MIAPKPKFKVGQVVSVKRTQEFAKIVEILRPSKFMLAKAPICYFLQGWVSAQPENKLRALTAREAGR